MNALSRWSPRLVATWETLLIVAGLVGNFLLLPHVSRWDGWVRYDALSQLLTNGQLPEIKYSMLGPIFATPLWYLGDVIENPEWWINRYNVFVLAAGMLALYLVLRKRVEPALLRKFFLLLVVASMFGNHLLFFYGEVFTAVLGGVGLAAAVVGPRIVGWATAILAVVNIPATIAGLGTATFYRVVASRRLRYGLVLVAAGAAILAANYIQRGEFFGTGYEDDHGPETVMPYSGLPGFSNPVFFGVLGLLFAAGKGLLFFAPGLFLPVRRSLTGPGEDRVLTVYRMWLAFLIGLVVVYAMWWSWHGGWFWGPRFLLFASVPASFALALRLHRADDEPSPWVNVATVVAMSLSVWVGINGAVYTDDPLYGPCVEQNHFHEIPVCYYTPEFSALWYPFVEHVPVDADKAIFLGYSVFVGLYLLLPLLATTAKQLWRAGRESGVLTWRYRW